jgi:hypothetical protein
MGWIEPMIGLNRMGGKIKQSSQMDLETVIYDLNFWIPRQPRSDENF